MELSSPSSYTSDAYTHARSPSRALDRYSIPGVQLRFDASPSTEPPAITVVAQAFCTLAHAPPTSRSNISLFSASSPHDPYETHANSSEWIDDTAPRSTLSQLAVEPEVDSEKQSATSFESAQQVIENEFASKMPYRKSVGTMQHTGTRPNRNSWSKATVGSASSSTRASKPNSYSAQSSTKSVVAVVPVPKRSESVKDALQQLRAAGVAATASSAHPKPPVHAAHEHDNDNEYRIRMLTLELERCLRRVEAAEAEVIAVRAAAERESQHVHAMLQERTQSMEESKEDAIRVLQDELEQERHSTVCATIA